MRFLLAPALALLLAVPADASSPAATQIRVPVVVADARGRPVTTLTAADFTVTERGIPVTVVDATFVPPAGAAPAPGAGGAEAPDALPAGARVVALFLDEYHVAPERTSTVRDSLAGFLREQLSPRDRVLVVRPLDSLLELSLRGTVADALAAVASFEGRQGRYEARSAFERDLMAADPVQVERARAQIAASAIQAMTTTLARAGAGRTALLVVSEGTPPEGRGPRDRRLLGDGLVRIATRGNVMVSTFDPSGQAVGSAANGAVAGSGGGLLSELVRQTEGRHLFGPGGAGLANIVRDLESYYLVTLDGAADGQFHPLSVRVRGGLSARTRPGYWAISPDELTRLTRADLPVAAKPPALPPVRSSRLIVPWVGRDRGQDGRTRITLVWEAAPARAGERSRVLPPSHVVVKALLPDGALAYEGMVQAASSGLGTLARATFEVPPGRVRLQLSIEDASARVLDTDVREVVVEPWQAPLAFGTPRVFRARTAREFQRLENDADALPVAARNFSRGERILVRLPVYLGVGATGETTVTAALTNRGGRVMRSLPVAWQPSSEMAAVDLPLAGLVAGEYSIQWRAVAGAHEVRETVLFQVTP